MLDALVGGIVGGLIVVVGLAGALVWREQAARSAAQWADVRRCATHINLAIGRVLYPMFGQRRLASEDSWAESNHALMQALVELRVVARGKGQRLAQVRYLAYALTLRLQAAEEIFQQELRSLDRIDLSALTGVNQALQRLVFGELDPALPPDAEAMDAAVQYLVDNGLDADRGWYRPSS